MCGTVETGSAEQSHAVPCAHDSNEQHYRYIYTFFGCFFVVFRCGAAFDFFVSADFGATVPAATATAPTLEDLLGGMMGLMHLSMYKSEFDDQALASVLYSREDRRARAPRSKLLVTGHAGACCTHSRAYICLKVA